MGAFLGTLLGEVGKHELSQQAQARQKKEQDQSTELAGYKAIMDDRTGAYTDAQKQQAAEAYADKSGIYKNKHYGGFIKKIIGGMTGDKSQQSHGQPKVEPGKTPGTTPPFQASGGGTGPIPGIGSDGNIPTKNGIATGPNLLNLQNPNQPGTVPQPPAPAAKPNPMAIAAPGYETLQRRKAEESTASNKSAGEHAYEVESGRLKAEKQYGFGQDIKSTTEVPHTLSRAVKGSEAGDHQVLGGGEADPNSYYNIIQRGKETFLVPAPAPNDPIVVRSKGKDPFTGEEVTFAKTKSGKVYTLPADLPAGERGFETTHTTTTKDAFGDVTTKSDKTVKKPLGSMPGNIQGLPSVPGKTIPFDPSHPDKNLPGSSKSIPAQTIGYQFDSLPSAVQAQAKSLGITSSQSLAKSASESISALSNDRLLASAQLFAKEVQSGKSPASAITSIGKMEGKTGAKQLKDFLYKNGILANMGASPATNVRNSADQAQIMLGILPRIRELTEQLKGDIGPINGRMEDFLTGKVGASFDPKFAEYKSLMALFHSGLMKMHFGARGGLGLMEEFKDLWATKMDYNTINNSLNAAEQLAKQVKSQASANMYIDPTTMKLTTAPAGSTGKVPGTGIKHPDI